MSGPVFSSSECEIILQRYYNSDQVELLDYSTRPLSDEVKGFLAEHFWLDIHAKHHKEITKITLFTKVQPVSYELQCEYSRSVGAFERETFFFETLIPEYKKYAKNFDETIVPKYYFAKDNAVIVLQDAGENNFKVSDALDIMSIDHIKAALKSFAKLHGAGLVYEEEKSEELGRTYRLTDDYEEFFGETIYKDDKDFLGYKHHLASLKCIEAVIDVIPNEDREEFRKKIYKLVRSCFELCKPTQTFRNVCCNGDVWQKNLMLKDENDGSPVVCMLIDFQLLKYNPPVYDVLNLIYQVTSSEIRQHHFDDLLSLYYDYLCEAIQGGGIDPTHVIPRDQFQSSIKYVIPYVKMTTLFDYTFHKPGPEHVTKIMADAEAFKTYAFADRSSVVPQFYHDGTYFKKWIDELLFEIKEILDNDNFSREDCNVVLKNKLQSADYKLLKYNFKSIGANNGFLGEHKKLEVLLQDSKQQFFVKLLPKTKISEFVVASGAFDNEVFSYEHAFKEMSSMGIQEIDECIAKCYFSRRNDVIVVQDLEELGYQSINNHKALDYNHVCVILKALAKLHASNFIFEEKHSETSGTKFRTFEKYKNNITDVIYSTKEDHIGKLVIQASIKGVQTHIDLFSEAESTISVETFKDRVTKLYGDLMYELSASSKTYRNVICHGDLYAGNILMKYNDNSEPIEAKLVDFQFVKLCPPAQDVMTFIYLTTTRDFRAKHMSKILLHYYQELSDNLAKYGYDVANILPENEFQESCAYYKTMAIAMAVTHFHFIKVEAAGMDLLLNDDEFCHKTFYCDPSDFIVQNFERSSGYKQALDECLKDLRILCEKIVI